MAGAEVAGADEKEPKEEEDGEEGAPPALWYLKRQKQTTSGIGKH